MANGEIYKKKYKMRREYNPDDLYRAQSSTTLRIPIGMRVFLQK